MDSKDSALIIDFGSQVTQLIARRLREAGVYTEILPHPSAENLCCCAARRHPIRRAEFGGNGGYAARPAGGI